MKFINDVNTFVLLSLFVLVQLFSVMKRTFFCSVVLLLFAFTSYSQQPKMQGLVSWLSFEEAEKKVKENPKPILVDVYTDWCGWCKRMMLTTYSDPQVADYINTYFYPVAFNAETKDTIRYQGTTYVNPAATGKGTHQLAAKLSPQRLSYPTTLFMNDQFQHSTLVPGYLEAKTIAPILVFYKEKIYTDANINDFIAYFDSTFTPASPVLKSEQTTVNWLPLQDALNQNQDSPRKVLIHLTSPDCISCKVMDSTTYRQSDIVRYLNENYYTARFDITSRDTITILNQKLYNTGVFHQLVHAALKNQVELPAVLILNERNELISPVPQYMTPSFLKPVLMFFKEDHFQSKSFSDFYEQLIKK